LEKSEKIGQCKLTISLKLKNRFRFGLKRFWLLVNSFLKGLSARWECGNNGFGLAKGGTFTTKLDLKN
jgi:hypothetical protein